VFGTLVLNVALLAGASLYLHSDYMSRLNDLKSAEDASTSNMVGTLSSTTSMATSLTNYNSSLQTKQSDMSDQITQLQMSLSNTTASMKASQANLAASMSNNYASLNSNINAVNASYNSTSGNLQKDDLIANRDVRVGQYGYIGHSTDGNVALGNLNANSLVFNTPNIVGIVDTEGNNSSIDLAVAGTKGGRLLLGAPVNTMVSTLQNDLTLSTNNDLSLGAGGVNSNEYMRITKDGRIGIGTRVPTDKLSVQDGNISVGSSDTSGASVHLNNAQSKKVALSSVPGQSTIGTAGDAVFGAGGFNTDHLHIKPNGYIGMGATDPQSRLHVVGNMLLASTADDIMGTAQLSVQSGDSVFNRKQRMDVAIDGHDGRAYINTNHDQSIEDVPFGIRINNQEHVTVMPNGFVGVGTKTPQYQMDVAGPMRAQKIALSDNSYMTLGKTGSNNETMMLCRQKQVNGVNNNVCSPLVDINDVTNAIQNQDNINMVTKAVIDNLKASGLLGSSAVPVSKPATPSLATPSIATPSLATPSKR